MKSDRGKGLLEWTGERFVPWVYQPGVHYYHLHRYAFALRFVEGKKVLDLACGEGYGSNMLADKAEHVMGIDIDETSIKHAEVAGFF